MTRMPIAAAARRTLDRARAWVAGAWARGNSTASEMVEQAIILMFSVLRLGLIAQLVIAVIYLAGHPAQWVLLLVTLVALVFSVALLVVANHRGRIPAAWGYCDLAIALTSMVVVLLIAPDEWVSGSWHNWTNAYVARSATFMPAWQPSIRGPVIVGLLASATYIGANGLRLPDQWLRNIENAVDFPVYVVTAAVFAHFARRAAAVADANRARAIELGTHEGLTRYQHQVHNATGLLAQLSRPDTSTDLLASLRGQAAEESNRLRLEVLQAPGPAAEAAPEDGQALTAVVWDACARFTGLPLAVSTALGRSVRLTSDEAGAVQAALVALLYNVQFHARADEVTLHTDGWKGGWEVTVADDGVGFDPAATRYGFGLATQVVESLARHDITVTIDSRRGEGTCITLRGTLRAGEPRSPSSSTTAARPGTPSSSPTRRSTSSVPTRT